jgi:uncharacterized protein YggL (DUF469 family)
VLRKSRNKIVEEFELNFEFVAGLSQAVVDQFWDDFIEQAIESQGLVFGGGGDASISGVVSSGAMGHITQEHRMRICGWLRSRQEVSSYNTGAL